jgi:hypothetical protein
MKRYPASVGPLFLLALVAAPPLGAQAPAPAPAPAAAPVTPRDPKSPLPGYVDGRGPTGPVQVTITSPKQDEIIPIPPAAAGQPPEKGAPVEVKIDVKNYEIFQDAATQTGQHVHIVLDNLPYFAYYDLSKPWLFKKVPKGTHTLRVFPSRPWHESIKEPGAFAMVTFHVGEKDGKNTPDPTAPLLTYSRPKGKYSGAEAQKVMLDFYVANCAVAEQGTPNSCRVRYRLDDRPEVTLDKWEPVWWEGLAIGKHEYVIGLTRDGKILENGPFNLVKGSFELEAGGGSGHDHGAAPAPAGTAPTATTNPPPGTAPAAAPPATH